MTMHESFESKSNDAPATGSFEDLSELILIALRRVMRAVDIHSRRLMQSHGLTGPQALVLQAVVSRVEISAGELAGRISLSQATVTDIVSRLEQRGLLTRARSEVDRRKVIIRPTLAGITLMQAAPPLLQETFTRRFAELKQWEQLQLLASLQRIAELMDAERLDAAPLLSSGSVSPDSP
jgi:DNA-binding MarR family transcriptional regulator